MAVYSVPVTIGVDETRIAQAIEANVESQVVAHITKQLENVICDKYAYHSQRYEPLKEITASVIYDILKDQEQMIIDTAVKSLVDKLSKQKRTKQMVEEKINELSKENVNEQN